MKSIQGMMSATATVLRDGQATQILTVDIVPGDVVVLALGERVPADLRMITTAGIRVDQSILTGESEPVALRIKPTSDNYLESKNITFCGASVVEGSGTGLVVSTGNQTVMGSIAAKYVLSHPLIHNLYFILFTITLHSNTPDASTLPLLFRDPPRASKAKETSTYLAIEIRRLIIIIGILCVFICT